MAIDQGRQKQRHRRQSCGGNSENTSGNKGTWDSLDMQTNMTALPLIEMIKIYLIHRRTQKGKKKII